MTDPNFNDFWIQAENYLNSADGGTPHCLAMDRRPDVVVGNIGFDKKMDYTVIGDAVNTVFRLQELTKSYPNGIIIGENTRRAAQSKFRLRNLHNALGDLSLYELLGIEGR